MLKLSNQCRMENHQELMVFQSNFTKYFEKNIKQLVMDSFSYCYENENMSISQKQSIITLLPQINNDVRFLKKLETYIFTKYRLQDNDKMYCDTIKK